MCKTIVGTCLLGQVDPTGNGERVCNANTGCQSHSNFLPAFWHSTGVFISTRGSVWPCQGHLCPRLPSLFPEYSHEGRLQRVITTYFIIDTAQPTLLTRGPDAGPYYMGRIVYGHLPALRGEEVHGLRGAFVLSRRSEWGRTVLRMDSVFGLSGGSGCGLCPCRREVDVVEWRMACSTSSQQP